MTPWLYEETWLNSLFHALSPDVAYLPGMGGQYVGFRLVRTVDLRRADEVAL